MRKSIMLTGTVILFAFSLAFVAFKQVPKGPSANGQGALLLPYMNGKVAHFSFHAEVDKQGNVSGSWEGKSPGQDIRGHGTITCMTILPDGKTAFFSGVTTQVVGNGFPVAVGDPIWFKVQDNGEGSKADEDLFSDWYAPQSGCLNLNVPLYPIENGNIQVKP